MLRAIFPRLIVVAGVAVAATVLLPRGAYAAVYLNGSASTTFDVTLKNIANCTIAAANLDFGQSQGVLATAVNSCTNTMLHDVGLTAAMVQFNLCQTAGSALWGDTQGTNTVGGAGNGSSQPITVYGNIAPQATPAPDTCTSTITATVYF